MEKLKLSNFVEMKKADEKFAVISCYDYTTAKLVAKTSIEMIIVGDSAAQFMLGHDSTLSATMDFMVEITAAVRRAAPEKFIVADMPFMSYQVSTTEAIRNAGRFLSQAVADIVKVEACPGQLSTIKALVDADIPVMPHIGLRPQTRNLKAQGTTASTAIELIELSQRLIETGAHMFLIEGTARETAAEITKRSSVPVVSCGSGPDCDGQVLIAPDILGLIDSPSPKFSKRYGDIGNQIVSSLEQYSKEIHDKTFPDDEHSYHIKSGELEMFNKLTNTNG